jgi:hypothetical protein
VASYVSVFNSSLATGDEIPLPVWCRRALSKDIEIAVVGANLVGDALWVVPLIEDGFDLTRPSAQPEPNGTFIGLSARVAFHT